MPKTNESEKKQATEPALTWDDAWCLMNLGLLKTHKGWFVALHCEHGIINMAPSEQQLRNRLDIVTKKKIARDAVVIDVDHTLERLQPQPKVTLLELMPVAAPPAVDPFENPTTEEPRGEFEPVQLNVYAQRRGYKATEVLMKLLSLGKEGVHVRSMLDEATVKELDEHFPKKDPFASPHKQPSFQPRNTSGFDRGALIDGGGAAWRSRQRYD